MKLEDCGASCKVLFLDDGRQILFSYKTPVAGYDPHKGWFRTKEHFSTTTSKHINQYLRGVDRVNDLEQTEIEALLS